MKQSRELTAFYNAYNDWLMAGAPMPHHSFYRNGNLYGNLMEFYGGELKPSKSIKLLNEMKSQFRKAGLSELVPFGIEEYLKNGIKINPDQIELSIARNNIETLHLNPNRIAWVKSHLTEKVNKHFTLVCEI